MDCLICGAGNCTCKGAVGWSDRAIGEEVGTIMGDSTFSNAVYLDASGAVVPKGSKSALTKISRAEAERRGLVSKTGANTQAVDPNRIVNSDGSSEVRMGILPTPKPEQPAQPDAEQSEEPSEEKPKEKAVKPARNKAVTKAEDK